MIFCVVPEPLTGELFAKLESYYAADPNVTVIVERRASERRVPGHAAGGQREMRDRRRRRLTGEFPRMASAPS